VEGATYLVRCLTSASSGRGRHRRWRYLPSSRAPLLVSSWALSGQHSVVGAVGWETYQCANAAECASVFGSLRCGVRGEGEESAYLS